MVKPTQKQMKQLMRVESQHPGLNGSLRMSKDGLKQLEGNTFIKNRTSPSIRAGALQYDCSQDKYLKCLACGGLFKVSVQDEDPPAYCNACQKRFN